MTLNGYLDVESQALRVGEVSDMMTILSLAGAQMSDEDQGRAVRAFAWAAQAQLSEIRAALMRSMEEWRDERRDRKT